MLATLTLGAWGVSFKAEDKVIFATDVDMAFSKAIGATLDLSFKDLGERTARYAMIVDDLKVASFGRDEGDTNEPVHSSIDAILKKL